MTPRFMYLVSDSTRCLAVCSSNARAVVAKNKMLREKPDVELSIEFVPVNEILREEDRNLPMNDEITTEEPCEPPEWLE